MLQEKEVILTCSLPLFKAYSLLNLKIKKEISQYGF
jgi:hypothetical protein